MPANLLKHPSARTLGGVLDEVTEISSKRAGRLLFG